MTVSSCFVVCFSDRISPPSYDEVVHDSESVSRDPVHE